MSHFLFWYNLPKYFSLVFMFVEERENHLSKEREELELGEEQKLEEEIIEGVLEGIKEKLTEEEELAIREKLKEELKKMELSPELQEEAKKEAEEIKILEEEAKVKKLLTLAQEKGIAFSIKVAMNTGDDYTLDVLHDILAKDELYKKFPL